MKRISWVWYGTDYVLRKKINKIKKIHYCRRKSLTDQQANDFIWQAISSGKPFFAGRIGLFEQAVMRAYEFNNTDKYDVVMNNLYNCAGFFPLDTKLGNQFLSIMKDSLGQVDLLATNMELCENYFINHFSNKDMRASIWLNVMEPWRFENPWSSALKGKKVLVVHPFEESIQTQYPKRELLFQGTDILPRFELLTVKALQTTGDLKDDRFQTWFEALDYMTEEILKRDFDIALLGCGAYGFPLGARIKQAGKQAIHMGGVSQLLFGIMGKRWDGTGPNSVTGKMFPEIAHFYNENWIYPLDVDCPVSAKKVEYGPYWK